MALNGRDRQGQPLSGAQTGHRPAPRGGFISRGVNAVTGLAAEAIASRKDNKAAPTTYSDELAVPTSHKQSDKYSSQDHLGDSFVADTREGNISDNASELSGLDSDEEELDLDEAAQEIRTGSAEGVRQPPPTGNMLSPAAIKTLASSFVEQFPPPRVPVGTLQLPVILPQRRPGNKRRGFVQAYAPMLEQAGIGDAAFLSFCDYFEQAIKVSPLFDIVNLASNVVGFIPTPTAQIVSTVAWIVDVTAQEMYTRNRTNDFLGRMNETYFKPHGLFCMIVVYKPEEPQYFNETYDVSTGAVKNRGTPIPTQTRTGRFRLASAESRGDTEMPQPAPLVFPQLEKWAEQGGTPYKTEKAGFLRDYFDRRAQATFAHQNPNAVIAAEPSFATRWADPTYQSQFGGRPSRQLLGAITGSGPTQATTQRNDYRASRREAKRERRQQKRAARGPGLIGGVMDGVQQLATGRKPDPAQQGQGPIRRIRQGLREDVLYMIVAPLGDMRRRKEVESAVREMGLAGGEVQGHAGFGMAREEKGAMRDAPPAYDSS